MLCLNKFLRWLFGENTQIQIGAKNCRQTMHDTYNCTGCTHKFSAEKLMKLEPNNGYICFDCWLRNIDKSIGE